jgi:hypothetical protein
MPQWCVKYVQSVEAHESSKSSQLANGGRGVQEQNRKNETNSRRCKTTVVVAELAGRVSTAKRGSA